MSSRHRVAIAASLLVVSAFARETRADDALSFEAAFKAGYGTSPSSVPSYDPLALGIGGRVGLAYHGIYGGGTIVGYQEGTQYGLETGYGFTLGPVTLRPQLGFGSFVIASVADAALGPPSGAESFRSANFYLEPGAVVMVKVARALFVGADVNAMIFPSLPRDDGTTTSRAALTVHGEVGLKF